jgi:hypothetical protein
MKLRLLQSMAGIDFSHNVGDVIEVNDAEAVKRYVERGIAEIRTEVKIQFKEVFARVKRLEAIMIGASASIIAMLVMVLTRMP